MTNHLDRDALNEMSVTDLKYYCKQNFNTIDSVLEKKNKEKLIEFILRKQQDLKVPECVFSTKTSCITKRKDILKQLAEKCNTDLNSYARIIGKSPKLLTNQDICNAISHLEYGTIQNYINLTLIRRIGLG